MYSETCVKRLLSKRPNIGFQDQLSLNVGQKYCRMLQGEHSAILSTFIKLAVVIKNFVLSIFDRPFYTGLTLRLTFNDQKLYSGAQGEHPAIFSTFIKLAVVIKNFVLSIFD